MDKNKAIEKIKKCLALGKSANEHEAAQALKQAQALMREYGISDADVALSDIKKHACTAKTANQIPGWQAWLANTVKAAFGAEWYLGGDWNNAHIVFYGAGNKAELAAYAYSVLLRQLQSARRDYIATALKRVKLAKNKTYRADQFCEGWIAAVYHKVDKFANGEREQALLDQFSESLGLRKSKPREAAPSSNAKKAADIDRFLGNLQGKSAQLHHAMGADKQQIIEENV